jgi:Protein of unknown function (DUF2817)
VARLGPEDARSAIVVLSGTHGVEGFAGSALQTDFLRTSAAGLPASGVRVILAHALNAFGFAWLRRGNEDNVDLNRNFIDHEVEAPGNREYDALHAVLCPAHWNETTQDAGDAALNAFEATHGRDALANVLARGQYAHADGLFYGGSAPAHSNRILRAILDALPACTEHVTVLDIHTGLGERGACQLVCGAEEGTPKFDVIREWLGDGFAVHGHGGGFAALPGAVDSTRFLGHRNVDLVVMTVEFGTLPEREVLCALRADNWLHRTGSAIDLAHPIKRGMLRAFCPDDAEWRARVMEQGRQVIDRCLQSVRPRKQNSMRIV